MQGGVINLESSLLHHFLDLAIAQLLRDNQGEKRIASPECSRSTTAVPDASWL